MQTDRDLLEAAAKVAPSLVGIGLLALQENAAWVERNKVRNEFQVWRRKYLRETGGYFDEDEAEEEDVAAFRSPHAVSVAAQKRLASARAATRRAIVRAAAALAPQAGAATGEAQP